MYVFLDNAARKLVLAGFYYVAKAFSAFLKSLSTTSYLSAAILCRALLLQAYTVRFALIFIIERTTYQ